ncbi:hypothetical protein E1B28_012017 [Marasmius oreades]|uniref:Ricin B lectin domain-containing protein n=1 Tax=Marasmius oreades TaxID=181124 RepID=A0A9P7UMT0_9AGAR|nr:uncharacterized protein E1B28_012017 [Marasmius oreades]KAG7087977.1 hypothetical protein E1B28_012017 [Marasmius oreades]
MLSTAIVFTIFVAAANAATQLERTQSNGIPKCVSASSKSSGSSVVIHDCYTGDASRYNWEVSTAPPPTAPGPIKLFGENLCIDVKDGVNTDGTKLQLWTCFAGNSNQQFVSLNYERVYQWAGTNKCIDLTNGDFTDGNQLQIWTCDLNNQNQWFSGRSIPDTETVDVKLSVWFNSFPPPPDLLCLTASQNTDGAKVALAPCENPSTTFPSGNSTWVVPRAPLYGLVRTYDGSKCLDLTSGDTSNGNALQIWTCDEENPNQVWTIESLIPKRQPSIRRIGRDKCVDIRDGKFEAGTDIQIWDCDPSGNVGLDQSWIARQL